MAGLDFVNPALDGRGGRLRAVAGSLAGRAADAVVHEPDARAARCRAHGDRSPGEKRRYRFPAGAYDFIGAHDGAAGDYQMCSLFSPVLQFDDQATARLVAELAREALFDAANAEKPDMPAGESRRRTGRVASAAPGPLAGTRSTARRAAVEARLPARPVGRPTIVAIEGELIVRLDCDGRRVRRVTVRSTRPMIAARVLTGRTAADAAATVPQAVQHLRRRAGRRGAAARSPPRARPAQRSNPAAATAK